jgi:hypothetical protein
MPVSKQNPSVYAGSIKADYSERAQDPAGPSARRSKGCFQAGEVSGAESKAPVAPRQEVRRKPEPVAGPRQQRLAPYFLIRDDIYYIVDIIPHPK